MATYSTLSEELTDMITRHIAEIAQYVPNVSYVAEKAPESLVARIDRLNEITQLPAHVVSYEVYREACDCQDDLMAFLKAMNQSSSHHYSKDSSVVRILAQVDAWRRLAMRELNLTTKDVWELIAPAVPDHLADLGNGQYEARWWRPVPVMDIEILKYTEGIILCSEPFEPDGLVGGLALRFSVSVGPKTDPIE